MQVITIYWDQRQGVHHTLVCDVQPNGEHEVLTSTVRVNTNTTLDALYKSAAPLVGAANVRAYIVSEYVPNGGSYAYVSDDVG